MIFFGPKSLPFVFKNEIASPFFLDFATIGIFNSDNFFFILKIKVNRPVIDPIAPFLG
jgi:hypothetical protein